MAYDSIEIGDLKFSREHSVASGEAVLPSPSTAAPYLRDQGHHLLLRPCVSPTKFLSLYKFSTSIPYHTP